MFAKPGFHTHKLRVSRLFLAFDSKTSVRITSNTCIVVLCAIKETILGSAE